MSQAYDLAAWHGYFDAMLGATGVIFSLMIVAISFRVDSFSSDRRLLVRAAIGPTVILGEFVGVAIALMPGQTITALGYEVLVISALVGARVGWTVARASAHSFLFKESSLTFFAFVVSSIAIVIGEFGLVTHALGGLVLMMGGFLGVLVASVFGIWNMIIHHPNTLLTQFDMRIQDQLEAELERAEGRNDASAVAIPELRDK